MIATTRSGSLSSRTPLISTGTRVPSGRVYSFSYGSTQPSVASCSIAWSSADTHSGGVIARQLSCPLSCSARV